MLNPSTGLGVTTVLMGNCGFCIAPCRAEDRDLTLRNLTQVEGMSLEALREGVRWAFESFGEYLDMLELLLSEVVGDDETSQQLRLAAV